VLDTKILDCLFPSGKKMRDAILARETDKKKKNCYRAATAVVDGLLHIYN